MLDFYENKSSMLTIYDSTDPRAVPGILWILPLLKFYLLEPMTNPTCPFFQVVLQVNVTNSNDY